MYRRRLDSPISGGNCCPHLAGTHYNWLHLVDLGPDLGLALGNSAGVMLPGVGQVDQPALHRLGDRGDFRPSRGVDRQKNPSLLGE